jgi:hypothetical protein
VTNLFSQDLNMVDTELPNAFLNTIHSVSSFYRPSCNKNLSSALHVKVPASDLRSELLTLQITGLTSGRSSGRDAHCVSISGNQLPVPCSTALRLAEVLLEDVPPVETIGS